MASAVMEFDMGGDTPRGRAPDLKKRAQAEALRKDLANKVRGSLLKLKDRDTQQQAVSEMQKICDDLKPDQVEIVHKALFAFDGEKSIFARAWSARFYADVAKSHFDVRSLGKVVSKLCDRARDNDSKVREACAETMGELARIFSSSVDAVQQQSRLEDTQDLDSSVAVESGPSLNIFLNPILKSMESGDTHGQAGNALALAHVVFNSAAHIGAYLEKLTQRILAIMDRPTFLGRAELLIAIANIVEVCPEGFTPYFANYFPRIQASGQDQDFKVRKSAMEIMETLACRIELDILHEYKSDFHKMLETGRYDSKPPVRDAAVAAIQVMSKLESASKVSHDAEGVSDVSADSRHLLASQGDLEGGGNQDSLQLALSGSAPVERLPLQNLKSSVNRSHGLKGELSVEALSSKPARQPVRAVASHAEEGQESLSATWGGPSMKEEGLPTKETWNKLLHHFDRMTQQQTQLIEMVSSFGESSRERLELLEQKVYSIELRMSGMEQRQSLPGFPPTPARATRGFTPAAAATPTHPHPTPSAATKSGFKEAKADDIGTPQECS